VLQLLIRGESIDLNEKASISITEESPVFERDSIPGGFSFPFDLPATPRNRRIFGHPDRIQITGRGRGEFPFQFFLEGRLIGTGTANIRKATEQTFSAYLQVATGDFAGKISGKKLAEVDFGVPRPWAFKPEFTYPEDDFALFPIYNENFMDETQYQTTWLGNHCRLNSYESGDWYANFNATMALSPFPFLAYVVGRVFNHFGFVVRENVLATDPDLKKLVIYSNRDISTITTSVTYKEIYFQGYNGMMSRMVPVTTITRHFDNWDMQGSMPDMLISDFILAIRNLFNLVIVIDSQGFVSIIKRKNLVLSGHAVSLAGKAVRGPVVTPSLESAGISLHWEHDPGDLLFSEGFKDVYENEKLLKSPVETMDDLAEIEPTLNEIRLVRSLGLYYQYAGEEVDEVMEYTWRKYSIDFQDFRLGANPEEFTAKASTLPMVHYQRELGGAFIRCPQAAQKSNSIIRKESTPCTLRLLFYHGMMADSVGTLYPYGSSDSFDRVGNPLPDSNLSIRWDGETGLYNQLWKDYLTWWKTKKMVTWIITDPTSLEFSKIYEIAGNHYLLKSRNIVLRDGKVEPTECEFYLL